MNEAQVIVDDMTQVQAVAYRRRRGRPKKKLSDSLCRHVGVRFTHDQVRQIRKIANRREGLAKTIRRIVLANIGDKSSKSAQAA